MSQPLLKQGRFWTICLWASMVAAGLGALHAAWTFAAREAANQSALLVPAATWNPQQRDRALSDIQSQPEVREAAWLSPAELARETSALLPSDRWPEILSEEDAWLPWVLEVRWHDPLLQYEAIRLRAIAFRLDAQWKIVLWEDSLILDQRRELMTTFTLGGIAIGFAFLIGLLALATGARRTSHALVESIVSLIFIGIVLGSLSGAAMIEGFYLEPETWAVTGVTAFVLAAVLAPMIKRPQPVTDATAEKKIAAGSVTPELPVASPEASGPSQFDEPSEFIEESQNARE